MADYYLAPTLKKARAEFDAAYPKRDRTSDGWIGDASHAARASDHNPSWSTPKPRTGVVRAIDTDKDGIDANYVIQKMIAHPSTNYVIFNGYIWSRVYDFARRRYVGPNPHTGHIHLSILPTAAAENSLRPWGFAKPVVKPGAPAPAQVKRKVVLMFVTYYGSTQARLVTGDRMASITRPALQKMVAAGIPLVPLTNVEVEQLQAQLVSESTDGDL